MNLTWSKEDDLVYLVASALIALEASELPAEGVYPEVVQRAVSAVALAAIRFGVEPPLHVPALVELAALPPSEWGLGLSATAALLNPATGAPTGACRDWRIAGGDPQTEVFEREIMVPAITRCREEDDQAAYTAFRRLLIERPVLTAAEYEETCDRDDLWAVADLLPRCYPKVPAAYGRGGVYAECPGCGTLMRPAAGSEWICELERCARSGPGEPADLIESQREGALRLLAAPLRAFITGPGLVEIELERKLQQLGLEVAMWPGFDAYDLGVRFSDGSRWGIDAKDWHSGRLLGRSFVQAPEMQGISRFYLAVPDHRDDPGGNYRAAFMASCDPEVLRSLRFASVKRLVSDARRYLKESNTDA